MDPLNVLQNLFFLHENQLAELTREIVLQFGFHSLLALFNYRLLLDNLFSAQLFLLFAFFFRFQVVFVVEILGIPRTVVFVFYFRRI